MREWVDATSYSRNDRTRVPQTWELHCGALRIVVTRTHGLTGWWLRVPMLGIDRDRLDAVTLEEATDEAIVAVENRLDQLMTGFEDAIGRGITRSARR